MGEAGNYLAGLAAMIIAMIELAKFIQSHKDDDED